MLLLSRRGRLRDVSVELAVDDDLVAVANVISVELLARVQHLLGPVLRSQLLD